MSLTLTPSVLEAAYEFLKATTKEFGGLPDGDTIKFRVTNARSYKGEHCDRGGGDHEIAISGLQVGHTNNFLAVLAHEMIHLHAVLSCMATSNPHDAEFHKIADKVCKIHEFDRLTF